MLAVLLIPAAVVLGGLRVLVAQVPADAGRVQAWIEQQTHLRIEFRGLDARLRWFGPEVVLQDVRVLDRDGTQALFETREASIGLDLWNFFRTGQLVAGRIRFVGPDITVVRLRRRPHPAARPARAPGRPPAVRPRPAAGRARRHRGSDASTTATSRPARDRGRSRPCGSACAATQDADATGSAHCRSALGARIEFSGRLRGSLDEFAALDARRRAEGRPRPARRLDEFLPRAGRPGA